MSHLRKAWIGAAVLGLALCSVSGQAFELRPGVVVDLGQGRLYMRNAAGNVEAVEAVSGQTIWSSDLTASPLAVGGDQRLVCQTEPGALASDLNLVVLDAADGRQISTASVSLPTTVNARIDDDLAGRFRAFTTVVNNNSFVAWQYDSSPIRGMPTEDPPGQPAGQAAGVPATGLVRLDLGTGAAAPIDPGAVPAAAQTALNLARTARSPGSHDRRNSVDGRYALNSSRIEGAAWDKYRWTIVDTNTGQRVGQITSHMSQASFTVLDSLLIFETGPYSRRTSTGMTSQPLTIRAVSLETGQEVWSREVRDNTFRGPYPP